MDQRSSKNPRRDVVERFSALHGLGSVSKSSNASHCEGLSVARERRVDRSSTKAKLKVAT
jgi:hypothetical protein